MPSSVVARMHYDKGSSTLRIMYVSGDIYDYLGVPETSYKAMKSATSKGAYLNQHIKPNHEFVKVK